MGELFALIAAGVLTPGQLTAYKLADVPKGARGTGDLGHRRQAIAQPSCSNAS